MPLCPLSKTSKLLVQVDNIGWHTLSCPLCGMASPTAKTFEKALELFWRDHNLREIKEAVRDAELEARIERDVLRKEFFKGDNVAQYPTYEESYKRGVLEATKELIEGTLPSSKSFKESFDEEMRLRRKKLLTKKV